MLRRLQLVFMLIGVAFFIYFLIVIIHELGHYLKFQQENVSINEICLLGWNNNNNKENIGTAWIEVKGEYDKTFHEWWDCLWNLNIC